MNILITGASGLIGSATATALRSAGHRVVPLRRVSQPESGGGPCWNPEDAFVDLSDGGPFDAVIHLAGETIAQRWSGAAKARIRGSRVKGTRLLSEALAKLEPPPAVVICASATGFYGHRGAEWLDEASAPGTGFLAEVCRAWEAAADPLQRAGVRVAHLRTGLVLASDGGALERMLPAFWLGLGGKLGSGNQYWSWIVLEDLVAIIRQVLSNESLHGPVNGVSPNPVTNLEFTRTLGRVLRRPTALSVPAFAIKWVFGEMGEEAMLSSARVVPRRLTESGFSFRSSELETALRRLLDQSGHCSAGG